MKDLTKKLNTDKNLLSAFNFLSENNVSALKPYHNNYHALCVFNECMDIAEDMNISKKDKLELGIASIFHDFDHNGSKKDSDNIEYAIKGLQKFFIKEYKSLSKNLDKTNIENIIKSTEYPHPKNKTFNILEKIIQDADLISSFSESWMLTSVVGLGKEFNKTFSEQLKSQIDFLNNIELNTNYAKHKFEIDGKNILKQLNSLINIETK